MKIFLMLVALLFLLSSCGMGVGFTQTHGGTNLNYQVSAHDMKFETEASAKVKGHSVFCVLPVYDALMKQAMENLNANADIKSNNKAIFNLRVDVEDKFYVFWCTRHVTVSGDVYRIIREEPVEQSVEEPVERSNIENIHSWSKKATSKMNLSEAKRYCANLQEDGYSNWQLPTISEMRTLIKNCLETETGGSCKITDECLHYADCRNEACAGCHNASDGRYSKLGDTGWFWSSSEPSDTTRDAWRVNYYDGQVSNGSKQRYNYVRCVR